MDIHCAAYYWPLLASRLASEGDIEGALRIAKRVEAVRRQQHAEGRMEDLSLIHAQKTVAALQLRMGTSAGAADGIKGFEDALRACDAERTPIPGFKTLLDCGSAMRWGATTPAGSSVSTRETIAAATDPTAALRSKSRKELLDSSVVPLCTAADRLAIGSVESPLHGGWLLLQPYWELVETDKLYSRAIAEGHYDVQVSSSAPPSAEASQQRGSIGGRLRGKRPMSVPNGNSDNGTPTSTSSAPPTTFTPNIAEVSRVDIPALVEPAMEIVQAMWPTESAL